MKAFLLGAALLGLVPVAFAPMAAHAEGEEEAAPARVHKPKPKPKAVKPAPAVTTPAAPIPYTTYSAAPELGYTPHTSDMPKASTPEALPQPVETTLRVAEVPPPPPAPPETVHAPVETTPVSPPVEISLRCETKTTKGKRQLSSGTFYIDLFPSPVFPDQSASFKFLLADPNHQSLIRGSICFDTICSAQVSSSAYYLVNRVTKKGSALRITLDRVKGAFYAEEIEKGMIGGAHLGEQGYCTPQPLPGAKF